MFLLLLIIFASSMVQGQNLVPNAGFEIHDTCPTAQDQAQYSTGWTKYSGSITTPDYYNACSTSDLAGVPQSGALYQPDLRPCGAYMGLITYALPNLPEYREQVGIQLSQPLVIGQRYYLSFQTVLGGIKMGTDYPDHPSNNIGMRLSTVPFNPSSPTPIDNFAHLRSVSIITDSVNWTRISGSIIADSTYSYVMLGNFFDDSNTDTLLYNCATCYNEFCYYLVDNICVSTDSTFCNGGIDFVSCNVSLTELANDKVSIFPNPSTDDLIKIIFQDIEIEEISLTDVFGKIIYSEKVDAKSNINLNLSSFSSSIFFLKAVDKKGKELVNKKIVKL